MEEEKAAAYYEELLQKGGGAARFKQGLGYGSEQKSEVAFDKGETHSLLSNFVKQASPHRASLIQKEITLNGIRSKLQKPQDFRKADEKSKISSYKTRSRSPSFEKYSRRSPRHSRENDRGRHRKNERSSPVKRSSRSPLCYSSEEKERTRWNSSRRKDRSRHESYSRRTSISRSSASESGEERESGRKSHRSRRSYKERSLSPDERRRRRKQQDDNYNSSRRDNGHSKASSHRDKRGSSKSLSPGKDKYKKDRDRYERSKNTNSDETVFKEKADTQPSQASDPKALAEKVKAKMKLQLLETVARDKAKGFSDEWERFDFNKDAPLDDDAKLDYFGDGTGTRDDTEFLKNTGHSFSSSVTQAKREADLEAAHEAAIFGAQLTSANVNSKSLAFGLRSTEVRKVNDSDNLKIEELSQKVSRSDVPVVSEKVLEMQKVSWQERVRMIKAAKDGGPT